MECTVNRVGNRYFNQLDRSGHWARGEDLDLFAGHGFRTLRFPILWETLAPDSLDHIDWSWADERLAKLKSLGLRAIVGLLHHGSGPRYTDLIDPLFPEKFERFAYEVARRYPVDRRVHAYQRALDDRALQRVVRSSVSAQTGRSKFCLRSIE